MRPLAPLSSGVAQPLAKGCCGNCAARSESQLGLTRAGAKDPRSGSGDPDVRLCCSADGRSVPIRDLSKSSNAHSQKLDLLDDLGGEQHQFRRDGHAKCLGGPEVDYKFEFGRLVDR